MSITLIHITNNHIDVDVKTLARSTTLTHMYRITLSCSHITPASLVNSNTLVILSTQSNTTNSTSFDLSYKSVVNSTSHVLDYSVTHCLQVDSSIICFL